MAKKDSEKEVATTGDVALELRKVKALERIALNLEQLTYWFEDIDKDDWSDRIQWYLDMFKKAYLDGKLESKD